MENGHRSDTDGMDDVRSIFHLSKKKGWLWWFWLFFFENPANRAQPRQVAVLWSAKNDGDLECNGTLLGAKHPFREDGSLNGGIAAWYFDGSRMHDQLLLGQVRIDLGESGLTTTSPDTAFQFSNGGFHIVVGDRMEFQAALLDNANDFVAPWKKGLQYLGYGYEMIGINRLELTALVDGETVGGSGYFQKVLLGAPAIPWYWGIFHFENGACLSYFNPRLLGRSLKKDISLHDGRTLHRFNSLTIDKSEGTLPAYHVSAENAVETIAFSVEPYAETVWRFRKKKWGVIPVKFDYGQYPARITRLRLKDKRDHSELTEADIGIGVGNAEDSTGILF
jgi:hypothetical protein